MERGYGLRNHTKIYVLSREFLSGSSFFLPNCNHRHRTNSTALLRKPFKKSNGNTLCDRASTNFYLKYMNNTCVFILKLVAWHISSSE